VLLDPLEEQLDLPARLVQFADDRRRRAEQVGQEDQGFPGSGLFEANPAQGMRVAPGTPGAFQHDGLVADDPLRPIVGCGIKASQPGIGLGPGHEEGAPPVQGEQPPEVEVGAVHHIDGARLGPHPVEHVDVVHLAVGNMNEFRDIPAQVQQGVHLDCGLGASERRPGIQGQAQVDGGGVQGIDGVRQLPCPLVPGIQGAGLRDQFLPELGVHPPVSPLVGVGQGGALDGAADSHVIKLARLRGQAGLNIAQAFPIGQLGKGQDTEMIRARESPDPMVAPVAGDHAMESLPGQKVHDLSKQGFSRIHLYPSCAVGERHIVAGARQIRDTSILL